MEKLLLVVIIYLAVIGVCDSVPNIPECFIKRWYKLLLLNVVVAAISVYGLIYSTPRLFGQ